MIEKHDMVSCTRARYNASDNIKESAGEHAVFSSPTLLQTLSLFADPTIPAFAPSEEEIDPPTWRVAPSDPALTLPGKGLAQHSMLLVGEGCNRMFLVHNGRILWTLCAGKGWEYDDVWMLSSGNILFSRMYWAAMISPRKEILWRMDAPSGTEIHTLQPIGPHHVLLVLNDMPPMAMLIDWRSGTVLEQHSLLYDPSMSVHSQCRRFRMTAEGTYLMPCLGLGKVVEYNAAFRPIWTYEVGKPWAAVRLPYGSTLISDEETQTHMEVTKDGHIAWSISLSELPAPYRLHDSQSCTRLANGNTILCSRGNNGLSPQMVEVTREKEVVWVFQDLSEIGPVSAVQVLSEPGIPEQPGALAR